MTIDSYLKALEQVKGKNLYRCPKAFDNISSTIAQNSNQKLISFASNDYLSLAHNINVKNSAIKALEKYGAGAMSSRYISGNNSLYLKLEKTLANIKNCDDAIVFSSGYSAAIGTIPALVGKGDLIIADRLIHSSLIEASKLSQARFIRFKHNDINHAKQILQNKRSQYKRCLIISETVFSMDGDLGKIDDLLKLSHKFDSLLLTDAAHDLFLNKTANDPHHIKLGTLSKSVGSLGGYVAASSTLIDYLRNFAKSAIYSTALPPATLAASLEALNIIAKNKLGQKALDNANYFCNLMNLEQAQSAIVVIILGDVVKTCKIAQDLLEKGFLISAIRPPTVPNNSARLRISFSVDHKKSDIEKLSQILLSCIK